MLATLTEGFGCLGVGGGLVEGPEAVLRSLFVTQMVSSWTMHRANRVAANILLTPYVTIFCI